MSYIFNNKSHDNWLGSVFIMALYSAKSPVGYIFVLHYVTMNMVYYVGDAVDTSCYIYSQCKLSISGVQTIIINGAINDAFINMLIFNGKNIFLKRYLNGLLIKNYLIYLSTHYTLLYLYI
jgi:hypothetical protein